MIAWRRRLALMLALAAVALAAGSRPCLDEGTMVAGRVRDAHGPIPGARVRVQGTDLAAVAGADGRYVLRLPGATRRDRRLTVTAWAQGYYIGWTEAAPGARDASITLTPYYTTDNPNYRWFSDGGVRGSGSCEHCMPGPYREWQGDAHSQSARNPRFLTMYLGTDVRGNASPPTRYAVSRDYGRTPLPPDPSKPYYGPGYKLDFPDTAGNCATCHAPVAAARPGHEYEVDPTRLAGVDAEGVSCELCHKVGEVALDPHTGLPQPNMPGVLSMRLYRPREGQNLFFGTVDDVTRRVSYLPLLKDSKFCAPCHHGVFWDTVVYNSYGEWLASPYADPRTGQTCQDCHMPVTQDRWFVLPEKGGLTRSPGGVFSHRMPGAADVALLRDTATLAVEATRLGSRVLATVAVTNAKGGHHIPTDHPSRNILLVVSATDARGRQLESLGNQVIPDWGGVGSAPGDYAGRPGKGYARVLEELWTGVAPSVAYWNPTFVREDTRIPALATDFTHYEFRRRPGGGAVTVRARLVFRRAFRELAKQKKWAPDDILMEEAEAVVR